jgi:hypothetical protein
MTMIYIKDHDILWIRAGDGSNNFIGQVVDIGFANQQHHIKLRPWTEWGNVWFYYPDDTHLVSADDEVFVEVLNLQGTEDMSIPPLSFVKVFQGILFDRLNMQESLIAAGERMIESSVAAIEGGDLENACTPRGNWITDEEHWVAERAAGMVALEAASVDSNLYLKQTLLDYEGEDQEGDWALGDEYDDDDGFDDDDPDDDYPDGRDFDPEPPGPTPVTPVGAMQYDY